MFPCIPSILIYIGAFASGLPSPPSHPCQSNSARQNYRAKHNIHPRAFAKSASETPSGRLVETNEAERVGSGPWSELYVWRKTHNERLFKGRSKKADTDTVPESVTGSSSPERPGRGGGRTLQWGDFFDFPEGRKEGRESRISEVHW